MRIGRNRFKLTTRAEVWSEFMQELNPKLNMIGDPKRIAEIKLNLIKSWEDKGRNMAFMADNPAYNFQTLLEQSLETSN